MSRAASFWFTLKRCFHPGTKSELRREDEYASDSKASMIVIPCSFHLTAEQTRKRVKHRGRKGEENNKRTQTRAFAFKEQENWIESNKRKLKDMARRREKKSSERENSSSDFKYPRLYAWLLFFICKRCRERERVSSSVRAQLCIAICWTSKDSRRLQTKDKCSAKIRLNHNSSSERTEREKLNLRQFQPQKKYFFFHPPKRLKFFCKQTHKRFLIPLKFIPHDSIWNLKCVSSSNDDKTVFFSGFFFVCVYEYLKSEEERYFSILSHKANFSTFFILFILPPLLLPQIDCSDLRFHRHAAFFFPFYTPSEWIQSSG